MRVFGRRQGDTALRSCPDGTRERHRFVCAYLMGLHPAAVQRLLLIAPHKAEYEFARAKFPEAHIVSGFKFVQGSFVPPYSDVDVDIENIMFPDNYFDLIVCNHVLEHVPDDRRAMLDFFRVLNPGGLAMLSAPIFEMQSTRERQAGDLLFPSSRRRLDNCGTVGPFAALRPGFLHKTAGSRF